MKIISFNVNNDYRYITDKVQVILQLILQYDLDVLCLQEVTLELYKLLMPQIPNNLYISISEQTSFFNVIISRYNQFIYYPFKNSNMYRGFILHELPNYLIINTHLESGNYNQHIRQMQCNEILNTIQNYISNCKNIIILGDMNFTNLEEFFPLSNFIELQNDDNDLFTYDSKYNLDAIKPYRTNLDRIYILMQSKIYSSTSTLKILKDITISDHFPILAILK